MRNIFQVLILCFGCLNALAAEDTLIAMCYGPGLYGNKTANGQVLTRQTTGAAHRRWPLGSDLNLKCNGKNVNIKIIDRGPYSRIGSLDLTEATVRNLGYANCSHFGVRRVVVQKLH